MSDNIEIAQLQQANNSLVEDVRNLRSKFNILQAKNIEVYWAGFYLVLSCGDNEVILRHITKKEKEWILINLPGLRQS
jgi:hypothetical protein